MKSQTFSALDRLQAHPNKKSQGSFRWLDKHREDFLLVCAEKGPGLTAELCGLVSDTVYQWAKHRGHYPLPGPRYASLKQGRAALGSQSAQAPEEDALYWKGKAEAYREVLLLLLDRFPRSKEIQALIRETEG